MLKVSSYDSNVTILICLIKSAENNQDDNSYLVLLNSYHLSLSIFFEECKSSVLKTLTLSNFNIFSTLWAVSHSNDVRVGSTNSNSSNKLVIASCFNAKSKFLSTRKSTVILLNMPISKPVLVLKS